MLLKQVPKVLVSVQHQIIIQHKVCMKKMDMNGIHSFITMN